MLNHALRTLNVIVKISVHKRCALFSGNIGFIPVLRDPGTIIAKMTARKSSLPPGKVLVAVISIWLLRLKIVGFIENYPTNQQVGCPPGVFWP